MHSDFVLSVRQRRPIPLHAQLNCRSGELLALVGPSGSGKSTLLRQIAGLVRPEQGQIRCGPATWFDSAAGTDWNPRQRRVGYVPQSYGLFPHLSALANIEAGLAHVDGTARRAQAYRWLEKVHLKGLERRRPAQLSGGEQQRVALARALAREPALLVLDEPFSSVDHLTREALYPELALLKQELSIPVIMVTHDLSEALMLADRLTLLYQGATLQSGPPAEVVARPCSERAALLVGVKNIYAGVVQRRDPETGLIWIKAAGVELAIHAERDWPIGSAVRWTVPNSAIRLPRIHEAEGGSSVNRFPAVVHTMVALADKARVAFSMDGLPETLQAEVPLRLATAHRLAPGVRTELLLRAQALHLLPS
jgi:molybdate transport system ATP-binding protein